LVLSSLGPFPAPPSMAHGPCSPMRHIRHRPSMSDLALPVAPPLMKSTIPRLVTMTRMVLHQYPQLHRGPQPLSLHRPMMRSRSTRPPLHWSLPVLVDREKMGVRPHSVWEVLVLIRLLCFCETVFDFFFLHLYINFCVYFCHVTSLVTNKIVHGKFIGSTLSKTSRHREVISFPSYAVSYYLTAVVPWPS
jgi:hypothetical protein